MSRSGVDQGLYLIEGDETPEEALTVAYALEEGSRRFYDHLGAQAGDPEAAALFAELAEAEGRHEDRLWKAYRRLAGPGAERAVFEAGRVPAAVEGGLPADRVLAAWGSVPADAEEALDRALALEADSLDLYLRLAREFEGRPASAVFRDLASEERAHLARLGERRGRRASGGN